MTNMVEHEQQHVIDTSKIGKVIRSIASANELVANVDQPSDTKKWIRITVGFHPSAKAISKYGVAKAHASTLPPSTWLDKTILHVIKEIELELSKNYKVQMDVTWHGRPLYIKIMKS